MSLKLLPYKSFRWCVKYIGGFLGFMLFPLSWLLLYLLAIMARYRRGKRIDVGLGSDPLINNVYHKRALEKYGYSAETFVRMVYHITAEFDVRGDKRVGGWLIDFVDYYLFVRSLFRYRCLYFYFEGGSLSRTRFWRSESFFYRTARIKTVVMPYGGDVQDFLRSTNLIFRNADRKDYPQHRFLRKKIIRRIDTWTLRADHVISGCDWVEYMYHWDTLMLAHFSIDTELWKPAAQQGGEGAAFRILHAPNHANIKGTKHFIRAVEELRAEGLNIELVQLRKVPNTELRKVMESCDVVADQLIVGWYAMFALEGMSMGKPVLCFLRKDLEKLYLEQGLIAPGEIPIVSCTPFNVRETIRDLYIRRAELPEIGRRGRAYVEKHHSLEAVGRVFDTINRRLDILPASAASST